jgi:hypothetical protein
MLPYSTVGPRRLDGLDRRSVCGLQRLMALSRMMPGLKHPHGLRIVVEKRERAADRMVSGQRALRWYETRSRRIESNI